LATEILRSLQLPRKAYLLKKPEQFEYDYDNNNYSDYIEDVPVHAVTDIRLAFRWPAFYRKLIGVDDLTDVKQRNSRSRHDLAMWPSRPSNRSCPATILIPREKDAGKKH
jgi:hypothetical protein